MKKIKYLLLLLIFFATSFAFGQQKQNKITLKLKHVTVKEALNALKKQSGLSYWINSNDVDLQKVISVKIKSKSIDEALKSILQGQKVKFQIRNSHVIIYKGSWPKSAGNQELDKKIMVSGKVTDNKGNPLPGVTVVVKGTTNGTITDVNGKYSLPNVPGNGVLHFSFVGMRTEEIFVNRRTSINVKMAESSVGLNQVVVIGYGTQLKADVTGAVSSVKGEKIQVAPVPNVSNALAGQLPGLIVNTRGGEAGNAISDILIRAMPSLNGSNTSPLIIIDGVPSTLTDLSRLDPASIANISVLKGASAAIYGSESANGVILVTTKTGKKGRPHITYNGSFSFTQPTRLPKLVNGWQYMQWANEIDQYNGSQPTYSQTLINSLKNGTYNHKQYANTDWQTAVVKPLSPMTTHQIQISGGSKYVRYFVAGEYLYQDGIFKNSATHWNQELLRANIDADISKNLEASVKINQRVTNKHYSNYTASDIFSEAMSDYPFIPVKYPNGDFSGSQALPNAVQIAQGYSGYRDYYYYVTNAILSFNLKLPEITRGLYMHGVASYNINNNDWKTLNDQYDVYQYNATTDTYENQRSNETPISLTQNFDKQIQNYYNFKVGYNRSFGKHHVTAFAAFEQTTYKENWIQAYRQGFLSDQVPELFAGSQQLKDNNGSANHSAMQDFFGRLTYNYQHKYLLDFTLRRDGSYRFPANHRWGTFPSVSAGWRISQEPFFKNSIKFLSSLKLKASWGELGNDLINPYQFLNSYYLATGWYAGYLLGTGPTPVQGFYTGVSPNPNITWEIAQKRDIGLEAEFFKGKLSLDVDYFSAKRRNILIPPRGEVPYYTGLSLPDENLGRVNNHGIEASLGYQNTHGEFTFNISGNFTYAKNKVVNMNEPKGIPSYQKQTGYPVDSWLVYVADGIYKNQSEIDNSVHLPGAQPGDIRYKDVNHDGKITPLDEVRIHQSPTPEIQFGLNMAGSYKRFQFDVLLQGQARARQLIMPALHSNQYIPPVWVYSNRWTTSNTNASMPRAFEYGNNSLPSTFWLKSAAFLRLKTIRFSYALPIWKDSKVKKFDVYISGQNLAVISPIKNYDPEVISTDGQYYPQIRTFNLGVSINY